MTICKLSELVRQVGSLGYRRDRDGVDDTWDIINLGTGGVVTSIPFWDTDHDWQARSEALARLFTAAPDLLSALDALLDEDTSTCHVRYHGAVRLARAAIRKATGRA